MFATASTAEGVVEEGGEEMLGLTQRLPLQGTQMVHPRTLLVAPSRPGELHPEPLTDPDVNLSIHPARATRGKLPPSGETVGSSGCPLTQSRRG